MNRKKGGSMAFVTKEDITEVTKEVLSGMTRALTTSEIAEEVSRRLTEKEQDRTASAAYTDEIDKQTIRRTLFALALLKENK